MKVTVLFSLLLIFVSCSFQEKKIQQTILEDPSVSLATKLKHVLTDEYLTKLGYQKEHIANIQDFYQRNNYTCHWINDSVVTQRGMDVLKSLDKSYWFGIPSNRKIITQKNVNWIEQELYITSQLSLIYNDLECGFIDFKKKKYKEKILLPPERLDSVIASQQKGIIDSVLLRVKSRDTSYQYMAKGLYLYCKTVKIDNFNYSFKPENNDTIAFKKTAKAFVRRGLLTEIDCDKIENWHEAVRLLQRQHGLTQHGHFDKNTCEAFNESNYRKLLRAAIELDKIRQQPQRPKKYVVINIPSFELNYFVDDTLRATHRMITGKQATPTPTLTSKINSIVVYPYWNVPYSIAKNEILPAVKRNVNYLEKNNYKIYKNDVQVNPYSVNWKRIHGGFPYKVVQDPGPKNSLGIIKFEFYNNYSVYVHDTPSKQLFNSDVRTYSHGCMRCKDPVELGKMMLSYDSVPNRRNPYTADSLDTLIVRAANFPIRLIEPIPIFVEYHTVTANRERMVFHLDVYKKEEDFLVYMEK